MLQGEGSDADWMLVCRTNNFVIIDFLLSLLDSRYAHLPFHLFIKLLIF